MRVYEKIWIRVHNTLKCLDDLFIFFFFCHSSFRCCCFICFLICLFVSLPVFCFSISHNRLSSTISVHYFIPACIIALVIVSHANSHSSFTKEVFICTTYIYRRRQSVFQLNVNVHTANLFLIHHFLIFVEFLFDFSQIFSSSHLLFIILVRKYIAGDCTTVTFENRNKHPMLLCCFELPFFNDFDNIQVW